MSELVEWFGKKIGRILNAWDVMNIYNMRVHAISYKMLTEIDMLHAGVRVGVMGACDGPLIVAVENGGAQLGKAKFVEKCAEPDDLASAVSA